MDRSARREVRNPVLGLEGAQALQNLEPGAKLALRYCLQSIQADARSRADLCWRKHKAPMAVYWKCVAVYAGHLARVLK